MILKAITSGIIALFIAQHSVFKFTFRTSRCDALYPESLRFDSAENTGNHARALLPVGVVSVHLKNVEYSTFKKFLTQSTNQLLSSPTHLEQFSESIRMLPIGHCHK